MTLSPLGKNPYNTVSDTPWRDYAEFVVSYEGVRIAENKRLREMKFRLFKKALGLVEVVSHSRASKKALARWEAARCPFNKTLRQWRLPVPKGTPRTPDDFAFTVDPYYFHKEKCDAWAKQNGYGWLWFPGFRCCYKPTLGVVLFLPRSRGMDLFFLALYRGRFYDAVPPSFPPILESIRIEEMHRLRSDNQNA